MSIKVTSKESLVVEWQPTAVHSESLCDWTNWRRADAYFMQRPSNELLMVRGFGRCNQLEGRDAWETTDVRVGIDRLLAHAAIALTSELKKRLEEFFQVTVVCDISTRWQRQDGEGILVGWTVEEHTKLV